MIIQILFTNFVFGPAAWLRLIQLPFDTSTAKIQLYIINQNISSKCGAFMGINNGSHYKGPTKIAEQVCVCVCVLVSGGGVSVCLSTIQQILSL